MGSQPDVGKLERLVLATVPPEGSTTTTIAEQLGQSADAIDAAVLRLAQAGLVEATSDFVTLTQLGRMVAAGVRGSGLPTLAGSQTSTIDLGEIADSMEAAWSERVRQRASREKAARDGMRASDADRDTVVQLLSDAFSQGRLSSSELEDRTSKALSARTQGQLDHVLEDLGGLQRRVRSHPVRKAVFWVSAFLCSPFVLLGALLLAFGAGADDRFGGVVFLVLLLPGLFALWRWAWPRG